MTKLILEESMILFHLSVCIRSGLAETLGPATWFGEAKVPWMLLEESSSDSARCADCTVRTEFLRGTVPVNRPLDPDAVTESNRKLHQEMTYLDSISETAGGLASSESVTLAIRGSSENPDHHLWNNRGTWWCHFTVHRADYTSERVRVSLKTSDLETARQRRDELLASIAK